jgi:hypothetical protein
MRDPWAPPNAKLYITRYSQHGLEVLDRVRLEKPETSLWTTANLIKKRYRMTTFAVLTKYRNGTCLPRNTAAQSLHQNVYDGKFEMRTGGGQGALLL